MQCIWLLLLHCRPPKGTNILCAITKATIFIERSQSWTKVMIPKPMLWKTADGGRGVQGQEWKVKKYAHCFLAPYYGVGNSRIMARIIWKIDLLEKSRTLLLVLRTCDTNIAASISDREVYAAGGNMVSEVLEVGFWLVICWRSIFV